jgi:hypothetical protein
VRFGVHSAAVLGDVRFAGETSLFGPDACLVNGATQLFVCRSPGRADLPVQSRHQHSECQVAASSRQEAVASVHSTPPRHLTSQWEFSRSKCRAIPQLTARARFGKINSVQGPNRFRSEECASALRITRRTGRTRLLHRRELRNPWRLLRTFQARTGHSAAVVPSPRRPQRQWRCAPSGEAVLLRPMGESRCESMCVP